MESSFTLLIVTFYCYIVLYVALFSIDIYGSSQPLGTYPWKKRSRWLPLQIELARPTVANAKIFNRSFTYFNEFSVSAEVLSKGIVVRRAYFDDRKRNSHQNAIVFMLEMKRSLRSSLVFTGCRVGSVVSSKVHFRHSKQYDWAIKTFHVTTSVGYVDCYDINTTIKDGDEAYLKLKNMSHYKNGSLGTEIKSQRNVVVPQSRKLNVNPHHPSVVTCVATVRMGEIPPSEDGMLYQWLHYQKTIGVDHVHIIAEDTFVASGGFDHPIVQDALRLNFLSIDFWPRWFNSTEIYHSSQHLAYNDCLYRFQGVYDYVIFSDLDDFFVPLGESKSIKTYLQRWCSGYNASCNFEWHQYYPDSGWNPESVGPDGNLTATVYCKYAKNMNQVKSVHQIQALVDVGVHMAIDLLPGYGQTAVPFRNAYFAHLRKGYFVPGRC